MSLAARIEAISVPRGAVGIFWLGQAGFVFKLPSGGLIVIDAYLTDCCERLYGFKRLTPSPILPEELKADLLIASHSHEDHLDIDALPFFMNWPRMRFAGPRSCIDRCKAMGLPRNRLIELKEGMREDFGDFYLLPTYADHGTLAPDALGMFLDIGGLKIYYTGDTAYRPERMERIALLQPDILIAPINGRYGNLNPEEAALLAARLGVKVAIPCHFWTFMEHNGDPGRFAEALQSYAPECELGLMCIGEGRIYHG